MSPWLILCRRGVRFASFPLAQKADIVAEFKRARLSLAYLIARDANGTEYWEVTQ